MTGSRSALSVNGVVVCHNISNALAAVSMLFGMFYILNLHYPDGASQKMCNDKYTGIGHTPTYFKRQTD